MGMANLANINVERRTKNMPLQTNLTEWRK